MASSEFNLSSNFSVVHYTMHTAPSFQPCAMTLVRSAAKDADFVFFCTTNIDTWVKYPQHYVGYGIGYQKRD